MIWIKPTLHIIKNKIIARICSFFCEMSYFRWKILFHQSKDETVPVQQRSFWKPGNYDRTTNRIGKGYMWDSLWLWIDQMI